MFWYMCVRDNLTMKKYFFPIQKGQMLTFAGSNTLFRFYIYLHTQNRGLSPDTTNLKYQSQSGCGLTTTNFPVSRNVN